MSDADQQTEAFCPPCTTLTPVVLKAKNIPGQITPKVNTFLYMISVATKPQNSLASSVTQTFFQFISTWKTFQ